MGCSAIQLSHHICHNADDLLDDPARADRARAIAAIHHQAGLAVWAWTHEFRRPPKDYIVNGCLDLDQAGLWRHLEAKYDRFFNQVLPGLEGVILTFAETDFPVYKDEKIVSRQSIQERTARLINTINDICKRHGKRLAIRDFVYRLGEMHKLQAVINTVSDDVIVMSKTVPHDWHPYYPSNPIIGKVGNKRQWVEHDFGHEYEGQNLYPFANIATILKRLRHEHAHGVQDFVLRLDRARQFNRQAAIYKPWGLLELQAVRAFGENPAVSDEEIWRLWGKDYFPSARELVETATKAVCLSLFPQKCWLANHSKLPVHAYAASHIIGGNADRLAVWTGDPADAEIENRFLNMTPQWLDRLLVETDEGIALAKRCTDIFDSSYREDGHRQAWAEGVANLGLWAELFASYKRAYFSLQLLHQQPGGIDRETVAKRIDALEEACGRIGPMIAAHRLENGRAVDNFLEVVASLRQALSDLPR